MNPDIILHLLIGPLILLIGLIYFYFQPKNINHLYGYRTILSMKNSDTWQESNKRGSIMILWVGLLTCSVQVLGITFGFDTDAVLLSACSFLVLSLIIGAILVESQLRAIFDKDGNRK